MSAWKQVTEVIKNKKTERQRGYEDCHSCQLYFVVLSFHYLLSPWYISADPLFSTKLDRKNIRVHHFCPLSLPSKPPASILNTLLFTLGNFILCDTGSNIIMTRWVLECVDLTNQKRRHTQVLRCINVATFSFHRSTYISC